MYKLTGYKPSSNGNTYIILCTDDKVTEAINETILKKLLAQGVSIGGISVLPSGAITISDMYMKEAVHNFSQYILPRLARAKVAGADELKTLSKLASQVGILPSDKKLIVDFNKRLVSLKYQNTTLSFEKSGSVHTLESKDILDDDIVSFTKAGKTTFASVNIKLDNGSFTLRDAMDELEKVVGSGTVRYVGITPSNMLFKVFLEPYGVVSVKYDSYDNMCKNFDKIMELKTTSTRLRHYLANEIRDVNHAKAVITKISVKDGYTSTNYEYKLHNKYKTLKDVYIE